MVATDRYHASVGNEEDIAAVVATGLEYRFPVGIEEKQRLVNMDEEIIND
jgi:hypothetical protein